MATAIMGCGGLDGSSKSSMGKLSAESRYFVYKYNGNWYVLLDTQGMGMILYKPGWEGRGEL